MSWLVRAVKSSIGAKVVMALTGVGLCLFVTFHMLGNWLVFRGPEALNAYAEWLKTHPPVLWGGRAGVAVCFVLHVLTAVRLAALNRAARPVAYEVRRPIVSTLASRTMMQSGVLVLAFLLYHLAHFTWGLTHPEHFAHMDTQGRHDVYTMVVLGFQDLYVAGSYIAAMVLLGLHLGHGVASTAQTLGCSHPKYNALIRWLGRGFALVIAVGNISMPIAVQLGYVALPAGVFAL